jgi:hypothetical protein
LIGYRPFIYRQIQCAAHARVVERLSAYIQTIKVGRKENASDIVSPLPQTFEKRKRKAAALHGMNVARFIKIKPCRSVSYRKEDDLLQLHVGRVPVICAFYDCDSIVRLMVEQTERAVADELSRFDPFIAPFLNGSARQRRKDVMRSHFSEEGRRPLHFDFQRIIVCGADSESLRRLLSVRYRFAVAHVV